MSGSAENASYTAEHRFRKTLGFMHTSLKPGAHILDIGPPNIMADRMRDAGYNVVNTDFDLDREPEKLANFEADAVTAFEILEHLINPMGVLQHIRPNQLFTTVPLDLWFAKAYRSASDPWDRHFHEFEDWQFDWLLEASGWKKLRAEKWTSPIKNLGIRPLLRKYTPRYYAVESTRETDHGGKA